MILAVVGFLLILGSPVLLQLRTRSRRDACLRNMQLVNGAVAEYESLHGNFPGYRDRQIPQEGESRPIGWVFPSLPFLRVAFNSDQPGPWAYLHEEFGANGDEETRGKPPSTRIPLLLCPSGVFSPEMPASFSHLVANGGLPDASYDLVSANAFPDWPANGVFLDKLFPNSPAIGMVYIQQRDGANMTLLLSENTAGGEWSNSQEHELAFHWENRDWNQPGGRVLGFNRNPKNRESSMLTARASSFHPGGANVVFVSGAGRFLSGSIDQDVYVALMTPESTALKLPGQTTPLGAPFGPQANLQAGPLSGGGKPSDAGAAKDPADEDSGDKDSGDKDGAEVETRSKRSEEPDN